MMFKRMSVEQQQNVMGKLKEMGDTQHMQELAKLYHTDPQAWITYMLQQKHLKENTP